jgi:hypothetical protein
VAQAVAAASSKLPQPSGNGHASQASGDMEALVKTITDQVMQAVNGKPK